MGMTEAVQTNSMDVRILWGTLPVQTSTGARSFHRRLEKDWIQQHGRWRRGLHAVADDDELPSNLGSLAVNARRMG